MNYYMIQKTVKDFGPIAMKFIAANKDTIIKISPRFSYRKTTTKAGKTVYQTDLMQRTDCFDKNYNETTTLAQSLYRTE